MAKVQAALGMAVTTALIKQAKDETKDKIIKSLELAGASYPPAVMKHLVRVIRRVR